MHHTLPPGAIAVVRARLPYLDRRALSEAWFSSLRLESEVAGRVTGAVRGPRANPAAPLGRARIAAAHAPGALRTAIFAHATTLRGCDNGTPPAGAARARERRLRLTPALRPHRTQGDRAAFTVAFGDARVHVALRRRGGALAVVAVCSAREADAVRRALATIGSEMAVRGQTLQATVRTRRVGEAL